MVSIRRPSAATIRAFLEAQDQHDLTYEAVGATFGRLPAGYVVDRTRVLLGTGGDVYNRARRAIDRWDQFRLGWVESWSPSSKLEEGQLVAIFSRRFWLWWLTACRVVKVVDDAGPPARYGFAYGTLPDHAGSGEERFLVEWDRATDEVWYDVLAFSRPQWVVTHLGYPYMRFLQKRFGKGSAAAMLRAVTQNDPVAAGGDRP